MKNDILFIFIFITLFLSGIIASFSIPVLLLPSYEEKVLSIITEYYGMEPGIIEEIITKPIETVIKDITGIKEIYSYSSRGKSKIIVYLQKNEDLNKKSVLIKDAISKVSVLFPEECHQPSVYRYNTDDQPVLIFSVFSKVISNKDLFSYIDKDLKQKLLSIDGVANVEIYGKSQDEYFISLYRDSIIHCGIDYKYIFQNIVSNSINIPVGKFYTENSKTQLKFPNKYSTLWEIKKLKFAREENNSKEKNFLINAEDIINIEKKEKENDRVSLINNENILTILVYKKSDASILNISKKVIEYLDKSKYLFSYNIITDQGNIFYNLLVQLKYTIFISSIIVLILTYIFFHNRYYLFLIGFSIPVSIFSSIAILSAFSRSINIMSLSGIIIGIGTCVDNAIVMLEFIESNIKKYNDIDIVLMKSVKNSYKSIIASTLTTIIVFIPFFFIGMQQQQLYQDFALSISFILIISCLYSLLFIPSVIKRISINFKNEKIFEILNVSNKSHKPDLKVNFINSILKNRNFKLKLNNNSLYIKKYICFIQNSRPWIIVIIFIIISLSGLILFFNLFSEEISPMTEKEFTAYFEFEPKFSNDYKLEKMIEIGKELEKVKYNSLMYSRLEGTLCTIYFKFPVDEKKFKTKTIKIKDYIKKINRNDGFFYFQESKNSNEKSLKIYLFGDNLDELNKYADKSSQNIGHLKGVTAILKGYKEGGPQITIKLKPEEMYFSGVNDTEIIQYLRACFYYPVIMKYYEDNNLIDVRQKIQLNDFSLINLDKFELWNYKKKAPVFLDKISTISYETLPAMICRKNGKRFISLDVRFENRNIDQMGKDIKRILETEKKAIDFYYEFDEDYEKLKDNQRSFSGIMFLVLYLIYSTLAIILRNFNSPAIIMIFVPLIFFGALIFLKIFNFGLSIPVYLSLIVAAGYIVNVLILILEELNLLNKRKSIHLNILVAYKNKIKSIILTTATTIGSIFPLFFLAGSSDFFMSLSGTFFFSILSGTILPLIFFPFFLKYKKISHILLNKD